MRKAPFGAILALLGDLNVFFGAKRILRASGDELMWNPAQMSYLDPFWTFRRRLGEKGSREPREV